MKVVSLNSKPAALLHSMPAAHLTGCQVLHSDPVKIGSRSRVFSESPDNENMIDSQG